MTKYEYATVPLLSSGEQLVAYMKRAIA